MHSNCEAASPSESRTIHLHRFLKPRVLSFLKNYVTLKDNDGKHAKSFEFNVSLHLLAFCPIWCFLSYIPSIILPLSFLVALPPVLLPLHSANLKQQIKNKRKFVRWILVPSPCSGCIMLFGYRIPEFAARCCCLCIVPYHLAV